MRDETLHVIARIRAAQDSVEPVRRALEALIEPTRDEDGCLRYDLFSSEEDPAEFLFVEEWRDASALEAHFVTNHFRAAGESMNGRLAVQTTVSRYRQIG